MCIRLSGTKYCANDKHVHACRLNAKDMIFMVRPGLTVWWSVLNYSKWCAGIQFCIYYGFFFCVQTFRYQYFEIKHAFSIKWWFIVPNWTWFCCMFGFSIWMSCLHFVHHIYLKSAVLMGCIKGISISTDIYIHVCIFSI